MFKIRIFQTFKSLTDFHSQTTACMVQLVQSMQMFINLLMNEVQLI